MKHFRFCVEPAGVMGVAHGPGETWSRFQDAFEKGPEVGMKHPKTQPWGPAPTFSPSSSSFPKFSPVSFLTLGWKFGAEAVQGCRMEDGGGGGYLSLVPAAHPQAELEVGFSVPPSQNQSTIIAWRAWRGGTTTTTSKAWCQKQLSLRMAPLAVIQTPRCRWAP